VKGVKKIGVRLGNWLTAEQSQKLWQAPDGERLKEKRDRALLAILLACGLRRHEAVELNFGHLQQHGGCLHFRLSCPRQLCGASRNVGLQGRRTACCRTGGHCGSIAIEVGQTTETVEVSTSSVVTNTEQATVQGVLTAAQMDTLPVNGRNFLDFAQLEPGVQIQEGSTFDATNPAAMMNAYY
jgi:hypothetical protein